MTNYRNELITAKKLREEKNYTDAIKAYQNIEKSSKLDLNDWDIWDLWSYAYCLEQTKSYQEALNICKIAWGKDHTHMYNNRLYSTCIYFLHIKDPSTELNILIKAVEGIMKLVSQKDSFIYVISIFQLIDKILEQKNIDYTKIYELLSKIEPELLNKESKEYTDKKGKVIKPASDYEKYFSHLINTLYELNRFAECIVTSDQAMGSINDFHNSNNIWFKRRKAMSLAKIGKLEDALAIYEEVLILKPEYFVYEEIANIYMGKKDYVSVKKYIGNGILAKASFEFKINLLHIAYTCLLILKEPEIANYHIALYFKVREINGWKIPHNLDSIHQNPELSKYLSKDLKSLEREIYRYWNDSLSQKGVIKYIKGEFGFVESEGREYYFRLKSVKFDNKLIIVGQKVSFRLIETFDFKKQANSQSAVDIRLDK